MKTVEQLLASHCREVKGGTMTDADVAAQLEVLGQWIFDAGALKKIYRFKNYYETLAFVNALAFMVHREDHHPDLHVGYDRCEVRYSTHSVNGISENDFISAAKADAIYSHRHGAA
jgi:4a-hydroxytetrahydrobiopterin dehydratase